MGRGSGRDGPGATRKPQAGQAPASSPFPADPHTQRMYSSVARFRATSIRCHGMVLRPEGGSLASARSCRPAVAVRPCGPPRAVPSVVSNQGTVRRRNARAGQRKPNRPDVQRFPTMRRMDAGVATASRRPEFADADSGRVKSCARCVRARQNAGLRSARCLLGPGRSGRMPARACTAVLRHAGQVVRGEREV